MRVPYSWLREYCAPDITARGAGAAAHALRHQGGGHPPPRRRRGARASSSARSLTCGKHPDADRLNVTTVDVGDEAEPQQIVCGAPNVAAGQTVAVARPGAAMPDGTKLKKAKLRGVESLGMILSEDEVGLASDRAGGIMVLDDALAAGTPLVDVLPIFDEVIEFEITPNRPDCLGVYGLAREVHAATGAPLAPAAVGRGSRHARLRPGRAHPDRGARPLPALHRARLRERHDRPVAALAEGAPDRRRHAADQQRRRHHQLRDAAHGPSAARLRPRQGRRRRADGAAGDRWRADRDARRPDADARCRDARHRGRRRPDVDRRRHGRRALRGRGRHHARADGGRLLDRPQHPPHVQHPGVAQRGVWALREGPRARAGDGRPDRRDQADDRADAAPRVAGGTIDAGPFAQRAVAGRDDPPARAQGRVAAGPRHPARAPDGRRSPRWASAWPMPPTASTSRCRRFRRNDVTREADLVEEVGRFDLDKLPATLPKRRGAAGRMSSEQRLRRRAVDALIGRGAYEIVGWSFTEPGVADRLRLPEDDPRRAVRGLAEPDERGPLGPAHDGARVAAGCDQAQRRARQRRSAADRAGRGLRRCRRRAAARTSTGRSARSCTAG